MKHILKHSYVGLLFTGSLLFAQNTKNAKMAIDTSDMSCVQMYSANHTAAYQADMVGVGTPANLAGLLNGTGNNGLNRHAPKLTSSNHPSVVGYAGGVQWGPTDQTTQNWIPQGLTIGFPSQAEAGVAGQEIGVVTWHWNDSQGTPQGTRISIINLTDLANDNVNYRDVILVQPTGTQTYKPLVTSGGASIHGGGVAWVGTNTLYIPQDGVGFRIFNLDKLIAVDSTSGDCSANDFGKVNGHWCAAGYGYMLPQQDFYYFKNTSTCIPSLDFVGTDFRSGNFLLSGEYCDALNAHCTGGSPSSPYDALNGRLYKWALNSDGTMVGTNNIITPSRIYFMNEPDIQGVAADTAEPTDTDAFWLSSSGPSQHVLESALYRVKTSAVAKGWYGVDSQVPPIPEGMRSTPTPNLWINLEGRASQTNPATGGRALFYIHGTAIQ